MAFLVVQSKGFKNAWNAIGNENQSKKPVATPVSY